MLNAMLESLPSYVGPAAGLATSLLWTGTSLFFTAAGRRIGPTAVNAARLALAIVLLGVTHRLLTGMWWPHALPRQLLLLALSGVLGLTIGDQALFTSFVEIGPRRAMLVMTTSPLFAALFGWIALNETIHGTAWVGILLVIAGVAWVISERPDPDQTGAPPQVLRGVLLALIGAACQAGGLLLSKQGMGHGWAADGEFLKPQAATFVRMVFAGAGMLPLLLLHHVRRRGRFAPGNDPFRTGAWRTGCLCAAAGAVLGPYLGVWMSLEASDRVSLGIAQTLCSLPPIFILPFAALIHRERITRRAVLGALVAVAGVALLFSQAA